MDNTVIDRMTEAVEKAKEELEKASYLSESGANAGIRKMNSNKADWLNWVIYLAEQGLKEEQRMLEPADEEGEDGGWVPFKCEDCIANKELTKLVSAKDEIIEDIKKKLDASQLKNAYEEEYRKALINRAMIDYATQVSKVAHENCWLDGTFLVTPVEYLDKCLLELIKE